MQATGIRKFFTPIFAIICVSFFILGIYQNCTHDNGYAPTAPLPSSPGNTTQSVSIPTITQVTSASSAQCPNGGNVFTIYQDSNFNGQLDSGEPVLSTQILCNAANGLNSLISTTTITTTASVCASLAGVQINSGLDINNNGVLDPSEIQSTQIVCNGTNGSNGTQGPAGPAGSNGHSIVSAVAAASGTQCANGGSVILMALDVNDTGKYSALLPNQQSITVCNGQNAPVSAYAPVQPIMPCGNTVAYKEILLLLSSGELLASFSDNASGANTRLILLPDGQYMDTDNSNCVFSIQTSADAKSRSISWQGQVQQTWTLTK